MLEQKLYLWFSVKFLLTSFPVDISALLDLSSETNFN